MTWQIFLLTLGCIVLLAGLYGIGALALLFSSTIERRPDGTLIIKETSWHYRLMKLSGNWEREKFNSWTDKTVEIAIRESGISICKYYFKLFWTVILKVPIVLFFELAKCIIYCPFLFVFGYQPTPSFTNAFWSWRNPDLHPLELEIEAIPILPKWKNKPILFWFTTPIVIVTVLCLIVWVVAKILSYLWTTYFLFRAGCWILLAFAILTFIITLVTKVRKKAIEQGLVQPSLTGEYLKAKTRGLCPIARVE